MKKIFLILFPALFLGCADELDNYEPISEDAVELTTIHATIETSQSSESRANEPAPVYLSDHISRFRFEDRELMTFTSICRTANALARFNYVDVSFKCNSSGAWDRDKNTGHLINGTTAPERVYWSDALSEHTFIGYSLPNVEGFDWTKTDGSIYYGSIGDGSKDKTVEPEIDYNPATQETDEIRTKKADGTDDIKIIKKSSKMRAEDLLLTYSTKLVADASVANVKFYHALSSIKVQVSMSGFYGSELDGYAIVEDMKLLDQPTLYQWSQGNAKAAPRYPTHAQNNPKDIKLWDYYPNGTGSGASKSFTFYGITVPQETTYEARDLKLTFTLRYPDPVKTDLNALKKDKTQPTHWLEKPFSATIPAATKRVFFHPGQCTVINIRLNHMNEELTVGAEYMEWQFISTPDEGTLYKNITFLSSTERSKVKIASDNVTEDDATWLYFESDVNGQQTTNLLDIYKHDGKSVNSPFTISTADQLLAFAYEVKNGRTFDGLYVKLDADIYMQESTEIEKYLLDWIGIGDADHVFNGTFIGGGRKISLLKGSPLFYSLGANAVIDNLILSDKINVTGTGALANSNAGKVIGCVVDADVESTQASAGSLLGSNTGTVEACYHIGSMKGTGNVAGLVGQNSGTITGCYNAGTITGTGTRYYGVANSISAGSGCFYNKTLAGSGLNDCVGKTTLEMQKESFVTDLNTVFNADSKYVYVYNPAMYPTLQSRQN